MAVGIRIKLAGITEEQFDHVHEQVNPDRTPPKGLLFHASGPIDGGWGIIDFWESRADFDAFAPRIAEGMVAAGTEPQGPQDIKEFPYFERWFEELSARPGVQAGMKAGTDLSVDPSKYTPEQIARLRTILYNQRARPAPVGGLL